VDKAIELIYLKYMRAKISYEGIQRIERYFVPEAALREALLNAVCHKQYQSGVPIQISVYEDRLYVANVGSLSEDWTLEKLMNKHTSRPYNPDIAFVFYLAGFIESWGRGVEKICNALKADSLPMPEYTVNPGDIMIKFTGPEDRIIRVNEKVNEGVNVHVNDRQKELLAFLVQDPGYTVSQLSEKMHVSRKTIAGYLKELKDKGIIERIGSARSGHWEVQ
jgi:ATP-dependent DNA helicase RecG